MRQYQRLQRLREVCGISPSSSSLTFKQVISMARSEGARAGHEQIRRDNFPDGRVRLCCETCGATIWIEHCCNGHRASVGDDPGLLVACGQ